MKFPQLKLSYAASRTLVECQYASEGSEERTCDETAAETRGYRAALTERVPIKPCQKLKWMALCESF